MAAQQDGEALLGQLADEVPQGERTQRVQPVGRFVQHQEVGAAQQPGGDPQPLPHAERPARDPRVRPVGEVDPAQDVLDVTGDVVETGQQLEVLPAGQVGVGAGRLHETADGSSDLEGPPV